MSQLLQTRCRSVVVLGFEKYKTYKELEVGSKFSCVVEFNALNSSIEAVWNATLGSPDGEASASQTTTNDLQTKMKIGWIGTRRLHGE